MGVTKNIVVRPLGSIERIFQVTHDIGYYHNVGFLIRYKVPINLPSPSQPSIPVETKDLILQILYPTIEKMISKHPELAVCFTDLETSNPKFIRLREMDLNRIIRFELVNDDKDVESLLEKEHGERFDVKDQTAPLWRLVVGIRSSTVKKGLKPNNWNLVMGFFWHHSIADGRSSLPIFTAFNESIFQELNKIDDPSHIILNDLRSKILLPKKSKVPFNKTIEQCLDSKPSLTYLIREGFKEFILPTYLKKKISKGCWFGDTPRFSLTNRTTKTFLYSVSSKDMKSLVKLSRQHNTTITGLFNAAVIFSAYRRLITASNHDENLSRNAKTLAPYDSIKLCTNINLRPYTTPEIPWTQVGLYASESAFLYKYPRSDDEKGPKLDFWKLSKECREHIINDGIPESIERIGITKLIPRDRKKFEHTIKNKINDGVMGREFSISISNVGKIQKFSSGSKGNSFAKEWKINDSIFTQSADTLSSGMVISVISYKNKLTFVISAQDGAIDHKKIAKFGAGIVKCLKLVARKNDVTLQDLA